jgi:hypothetical protein
MHATGRSVGKNPGVERTDSLIVVEMQHGWEMAKLREDQRRQLRHEHPDVHYIGLKAGENSPQPN